MKRFEIMQKLLQNRTQTLARRRESSHLERPVHGGKHARDVRPLELAAQWLAAPHLQLLLPLEQFVREAQVRLDDDVEPARADEAAGSASEVDRDGIVTRTYYARGKLRPISFITSAMQMVALRDTPTRQCTSVATPSIFPRSSIRSARPSPR